MAQGRDRAFLGSLYTEVLGSVTAAEVLQLVTVRYVKVDLQATSGSRRGELGLLSGPPHLPTELPAQLHHPQSWHSDTSKLSQAAGKLLPFRLVH